MPSAPPSKFQNVPSAEAVIRHRVMQFIEHHPEIFDRHSSIERFQTIMQEAWKIAETTHSKCPEGVYGPSTIER